MKLPDHLFVSEDGELLRYRSGSIGADVVRSNYRKTHAEIESVADLKATLRAGKHCWPGGYPLAFWTNDGAALSFDTVRKEFPLIIDAIRREDVYSGWYVVACDVNWENGELTDAHTGEKIESAYGEDR